jgi:hypothetical protein
MAPLDRSGEVRRRGWVLDKEKGLKENRTLKVKLVDLHLSTCKGYCKHEILLFYNEGRSLDFFERLLDKEETDLVVLSGN